MAEPRDPHDDDAPLSPDLLGSWADPAVPAGFADRVLAARQRDTAAQPGAAPAAPAASAPTTARPRPSRTTRSRTRLVALTALVTSAAAVLAALAFRPHPRATAHGSHAPTTRESIRVGHRGLAVAEPGSALSFTVSPGGVASIDQPRGTVFYRVEPGGPFVVHTPAGDVTVTGTCFQVEVLEMKPARAALLGAGVGAALATTVAVTVYEGHVGVANPRGHTALAAGERATMTPDAPPSAPGPARAAGPGDLASAALEPPPAPRPAPTPGASREELLARDAEQRSELGRMQQRIRELEIARDMAQGANRKGGPSSSPFFAPSKDELIAMAGECRLKWDSPPLELEPDQLGPKQAARWGLGDDERSAVNQVMTEWSSTEVAALRALYVEVTGDSAGADSLTPRALAEDIVAKSAPAEVQDVFRRLSAERAGLAPAPTAAALAKASPLERLMRRTTGAGDAFEAALARVIGPERAHAARAANDGWGNRNESSNGCPDPAPPR